MKIASAIAVSACVVLSGCADQMKYGRAQQLDTDLLQTVARLKQLDVELSRGKNEVKLAAIAAQSAPAEREYVSAPEPKVVKSAGAAEKAAELLSDCHRCVTWTDMAKLTSEENDELVRACQRCSAGEPEVVDNLVDSAFDTGAVSSGATDGANDGATAVAVKPVERAAPPAVQVIVYGDNNQINTGAAAEQAYGGDDGTPGVESLLAGKVGAPIRQDAEIAFDAVSRGLGIVGEAVPWIVGGNVAKRALQAAGDTTILNGVTSDSLNSDAPGRTEDNSIRIKKEMVEPGLEPAPKPGTEN